MILFWKLLWIEIAALFSEGSNKIMYPCHARALLSSIQYFQFVIYGLGYVSFDGFVALNEAHLACV